MQKTLFLGNGINRLTSEGVSWDDVLVQLAEYSRSKKLLNFKEHIPFSLIYEGFVSRSPENSKRGFTPVKEVVAKLLTRMKSNSFHREFMQLGIKNIITSNYDYCLERSVGNKKIESKKRSQGRYSTFRKIPVGETNVWHIHGEVNDSQSITLGHEQYAGQLENLRRYLTSRKRSHFINGNKNFDFKERKYSWGEIFLRDDIHIVGFSLDYSEVDIWWLLAFKAQYESRYGVKCGRTFFYYWSHTKKTSKDDAKIELLKSIDVDVDAKFEIEYSDEYVNFISHF